jgi:hypothetical protein
MAQATGTTDTYDLVGLAEDVEDLIFNISPTDTPLLSMAKRKKATATNHQWQTDSLAATAANRAIEGDDSTYATATPTTMLSNYAQISKKTVMVSGTADAVRKYGRKEEFAYQIAKKGKELKRDIEAAMCGNQASSAGGSATARSSAGLESMISGNRILPTTSGTGTTPGYSAGVWAAPTDGTATGAGSTLTEDYLFSALEAAWTDGGDPSTILVGTFQKRKIAAFAGANKFAGFYNPKQGAAQGMVIGGVDLYVSDFGEHKIKLDRFMRTRTVLCVDPDYVSVAWLRGIKFEERAKTGDATRGELLCEWTLVADNPDAHGKVQDLATA